MSSSFYLKVSLLFLKQLFLAVSLRCHDENDKNDTNTTTPYQTHKHVKSMNNQIN